MAVAGAQVAGGAEDGVTHTRVGERDLGVGAPSTPRRGCEARAAPPRPELARHEENPPLTAPSEGK